MCGKPWRSFFLEIYLALILKISILLTTWEEGILLKAAEREMLMTIIVLYQKHL
jgi:uncharacterized protein YeaC (DUF1315 family)